MNWQDKIRKAMSKDGVIAEGGTLNDNTKDWKDNFRAAWSDTGLRIANLNKPLYKVNELPTTDIKENSLYLLRAPSGSYDAGIYYYDNGIWHKVSGGGGGTQGIYVGTVTNGGHFPTTRLDGSALSVEDYVTVSESSTFPFTIDGVTFTNSRDHGVYTGIPSLLWVLDPGTLQDTSETPVKDIPEESVSGTANTQMKVNKEVVTDLKKKVVKSTVDDKSLLYARDNGTEGTVEYAEDKTANTVAKRGADGVLKVGTPADKSDATTKEYVDAKSISDANSSFTKDLSGTTDKLKLTLKDGTGTTVFDKDVDLEDKLVFENKTQTIKNKTINANDNSITNLNITSIKGDTLINSTQVETTELTDEQWLTAKAVLAMLAKERITVEQLATPELGWAKTYVLKRGATELFPHIGIPLDYVMQKGRMTTVVNYATNTAYAKTDVVNHESATYIVTQSITAEENTGFDKLTKISTDDMATGNSAVVFTIGTKTDSTIHEYIAVSMGSIKVKTDDVTIITNGNNKLEVKDGGLTKDKTSDEFWTNNSLIGNTVIDELTVNTKSSFPSPTEDSNAATKKYVDDLARKSFTFKGYVATTAPTGASKGDLWYTASVMPTTFPIQVKTYDGSYWSATTTSYNPTNMDLWANKNNDSGYYWFGNSWNKIDFNANVDDTTIDYNSYNQLEVKDGGITIEKINEAVLAKTVGATGEDTKVATEKAVRTGLEAKNVSLTKESTATAGSVSTYSLKQGTTELGKIEIPVDYVLKSGSLKTCSTADTPVAGYKVGDRYLDLVLNAKSGTGTDTHVYVKLGKLYTGSDTIEISSSNQISVKDGSITKTKVSSDFWSNITFTGTLIADKISATSVNVNTPTQEWHATPKNYVDELINFPLRGFVGPGPDKPTKARTGYHWFESTGEPEDGRMSVLTSDGNEGWHGYDWYYPEQYDAMYNINNNTLYVYMWEHWYKIGGNTGSTINIDNKTIITGDDGKIKTSIGGYIEDKDADTISSTKSASGVSQIDFGTTSKAISHDDTLYTKITVDGTVAINETTYWREDEEGYPSTFVNIGTESYKLFYKDNKIYMTTFGTPIPDGSYKLDLSTTDLVVAHYLDARAIGPNAITTEKINNGAVTFGKINSDAISYYVPESGGSNDKLVTESAVSSAIFRPDYKTINADNGPLQTNIGGFVLDDRPQLFRCTMELEEARTADVIMPDDLMETVTVGQNVWISARTPNGDFYKKYTIESDSTGETFINTFNEFGCNIKINDMQVSLAVVGDSVIAAGTYTIKMDATDYAEIQKIDGRVIPEHCIGSDNLQNGAVKFSNIDSNSIATSISSTPSSTKLVTESAVAGLTGSAPDEVTITKNTDDKLEVKDNGLTKAKTSVEFWDGNSLTGTTDVVSLNVTTKATVPTPTEDTDASTKKYVDEKTDKVVKSETLTEGKIWTGTKAEYDAIATKDNNTLYHITDDTSTTDIVKKVYDTIYPVNSIVFGLQAPGAPAGVTWTDVSASYDGRYFKVDKTNTAGTSQGAQLPNIKGGYDAGKSMWYLTDSASSIGDAGGAFKLTNSTAGLSDSGAQSRVWTNFGFNANRSNSIYQDGGTVRPLTTTIKVWKRTA